jgi:hypothetical protein
MTAPARPRMRTARGWRLPRARASAYSLAAHGEPWRALSANTCGEISRPLSGRLTRYDVFLLEYDDERAGGFEPLADCPEDKTVVLGLVSSKLPRLKDPEEIAARVEQAAADHPASDWRCRLSAAWPPSWRATSSRRPTRPPSCSWSSASPTGCGPDERWARLAPCMHLLQQTNIPLETVVLGSTGTAMRVGEGISS